MTTRQQGGFRGPVSAPHLASATVYKEEGTACRQLNLQTLSLAASGFSHLQHAKQVAGNVPGERHTANPCLLWNGLVCFS